MMVSCSDNHIHKEIDRDFPNNRWQKSKTKTFNFIIHDSLPQYDFKIMLTHVADLQYDLIPIEIIVIAPDKSTFSEQLLIRMKDTEGKDVGNCVGDYCDVETVALSKKKLMQGNYIVRLNNKFPGAYLPNIIALGIEISESPSE